MTHPVGRRVWEVTCAMLTAHQRQLRSRICCYGCSICPALTVSPCFPCHSPVCTQGSKGDADCVAALSALFHVLLLMTKVMAPFTPFICEVMYQNLRRCLLSQGGEQEVPESVHFCDMPAVEQVRGPGGRGVTTGRGLGARAGGRGREGAAGA